MAMITKDNLLSICSSQKNENDYSEIAKVMRVDMDDYQTIIKRFQDIMNNPSLKAQNSNEEVVYSKFLGWISRLGRRRTSLDYALKSCDVYMSDHEFSLKSVNRIGSFLMPHVFGKIDKEDAQGILNRLYYWMGVNGFKECLEKLDTLNVRSMCRIYKVRALVISCDTLINAE
jgi:hypothetical protein